MEKNLSKKPNKIIVTYTDPDATDSSSDEEMEPIQNGSKKKVHEIVLNAPKKNVTNLNEKEPKSKKFIGVRMRESGKFAAEIRNPITKKRDWLGTFITREEASNAYHARKREIEEKLRAKQGLGEKSLQDYPSTILENETSDSSNENTQVVTEENNKNTNVSENKEEED
ncbi:hypothetical protein RD792_017841 [Penstemon davidsonii]|uniref:AP2/ERF domain-containing protein n=1 Tax=Penstemon davidsonii TaxID=160366 RepID=A0ABR0DVM8_9LAMI|nr:hypothetical protein RD792_017841 [Penstemon davidsonii]